MKILVVNAGSSSLKYQVIDMENERVIAKGNCERIGLPKPFIGYKHNGQSMTFEGADNHEKALQKLFEILTNKEYGVISSLGEIGAVGHRVLHGGTIYNDSVLVTDEVLKKLDSLVPFGPLHMPANIAVIRACQSIMPTKPQVAVFDTAFHATMPEKAYMYGIDYDDAKKYNIRKFGFHGTSHKFITQETAKVLGKNKENLNIIVAHIGNGSSITAVKNGKSVDTTMGLTPLQGLVMGTRSGDIDPSVVETLCEKKNMSVQEVITYLNKKCGMLGISGVDSDMRVMEEKSAEGNARCQLAMDMVCYSARKFIGSYLAVLGHVDAIVFTGGIGENGPLEREKIICDLDELGIVLDKNKNDNFKRGEVQEISADSSKVKIFVIPTNEELMMARDTKNIVEGLRK